jgi:hypothetical protein
LNNIILLAIKWSAPHGFPSEKKTTLWNSLIYFFQMCQVARITTSLRKRDESILKLQWKKSCINVGRPHHTVKFIGNNEFFFVTCL